MDNNANCVFNLNVINEYVCEVRFKPNSKLLDHRGKIAESLSLYLDLPHWKITANRIDIFDVEGEPDEANIRGFLSFRNTGFVYRDAPSGNEFYKKTEQMIDFIYEQTSVFNSKTILINRVGVKTRIGNQYNGPFSSLLDLYKTKYFYPSQLIEQVFEGRITDIGGFLTLKSSQGFDMNTMSGPMEGQQLREFFPFHQNPPEPILYFEIDSYLQPNREINKYQLKNTIEDLIRNNWSINNKVVAKILGDKI